MTDRQTDRTHTRADWRRDIIHTETARTKEYDPQPRTRRTVQTNNKNTMNLKSFKVTRSFQQSYKVCLGWHSGSILYERPNT